MIKNGLYLLREHFMLHLHLVKFHLLYRANTTYLDDALVTFLVGAKGTPFVPPILVGALTIG